jgi:hypothetical protein
VQSWINLSEIRPKLVSPSSESRDMTSRLFRRNVVTWCWRQQGSLKR